MANGKFKYFIDICFSVLFVYALLGLISGPLAFISDEGLAFLTEKSWIAAGVVSLVVWLGIYCCTWYSGKTRKAEGGGRSLNFVLWIFLLGLVLYLFSDSVGRKFGFYQSTGVRAEIIYSGVLLLLGFLLGKRLLGEPCFRSFLSLPVLLFFQIVLIVSFLGFADGRLIFSDDHPSFLYRLQLLKEHFPYIPFYNTDWNAGYSAREFFPSGSLNVFFISLPILGLLGDLSNFDNAVGYTFLIPYLFIFIVPLSVYAAARLFGCRNDTAVLAAIFALGPSMGFFEWMLKYGTLGFAFSVGLVPLGVSLCWRLALAEQKPSWLHVFALLLVSFLVLCWTLSALAFLPVLACALFRYRVCFAKQRVRKVLAFALLFLLVNGPWILVFVEESKVLSFLAEDTLPGSTVKHFDAGRKNRLIEGMAAKGVSSKADSLQQTSAWSKTESKLKRVRKRFRELLFKVNPLLLLFFIPGIFLIPAKRASLVLGGSVFWLLVVGAVGDFLKPQLELGRMLIPGSFLMCILAGAAVVRLIEQLENKMFQKGTAVAVVGSIISVVALIFVLGSIVLSPLTAGAAYLNRSDEKFVFSPELTKHLGEAIRQHGGSGRTFFVGFILQELGATHWAAQDGGHIAPLAAFSGKPLYAFDYYHYRWSTVDPIPQSYRSRGPQGIEEFLDLVNTTAVVTFKREWADYCLNTPRYRQVFREGRFRLFVRDGAEASYFLEGEGEVRRAKEGFVVRPKTLESVIKFRYLPKLKVNLPELAEIYPVEVFEEEVGGGKKEQVYFVGLRVREAVVAQGKEIRIGYYP